MTREEIMKLDLEGINERMTAIKAEMDTDGADFEALNSEVDAIEERKAEIKKVADAEAELRKKVATGEAGTVVRTFTEKKEGTKMPQITEQEQRANDFMNTGHMEFRALLASGKIAQPTKVGGINDLGESANMLVDDVTAVPVEGFGAYVVAYKETEASAADHADGEKVGGTGAGFDKVTINPAEWGVLDSISKLVKKTTPLNYQQKIESAAVIGLRNKACDKIVAAVTASKLAEKVIYTLDENFVRSCLLGFRAIAGKGAVSLYIAQADLATLGKVRGADKKPVYEIAFDAGSTLSGVIKDGGSAVRFRVLDQLKAGTQLFGQPATIEMPMWGNYTVETDEGGSYFDNNLIGIKGLQTANADLCALHGMQVIKQA